MMERGHSKLELLSTGFTTQPEHLVLRTPTLARMRFPALVALLMHEKHGPILYDTGYSPRFYEATRPFPERLYAWATPVRPDPTRSAVAQLERRGIRKKDVEWIFVSHFHADHVAGLADFPSAKYIYFRHALEGFLPLGRFAGTTAAFLRGLLPSNLEERSRCLDLAHEAVPLPPECMPFVCGVDIFGDGAMFAVELPGHTDGQLGLFVRRENGSLDFLIGDACWTSRTFRERRLPHPVAKLLFSNWDAYADTVERIADLHERVPDLRILPSHCDEVRARYVADIP